ncbi:MAG: hypothetical protein JRN20_18025 [Nitrososphaerota archaeon]|nr:hypothetical protein [Nitrososphaerota archaeon]
MSSSSARSAIIFASGMEDKTMSRHFSPDEEGTLIEYVMDSVWTVADELIVVFGKEPALSTVEAIAPFGAKVITVEAGQNPMNSILEGFKSSRAEHCFLVTERVPLLKPNVTLSLFENALGYDLAIPKWNSGKLEPMLAVYRKNALLKLASTLNRTLGNNMREEMLRMAEQLFAVKYVSVESDLMEIDPELDSFFWVDEEESLAVARAKVSVKGKKP